jgi:hypothetical protein
VFGRNEILGFNIAFSSCFHEFAGSGSIVGMNLSEQCFK